MNDTVIGIDLAKRQHQLHGENKNEKAILKKRVDREDLVSELAKVSPAVTIHPPLAVILVAGRGLVRELL